MLKVLYIEDEPSLAKIVKETLELKGFKVEHLISGLGALEKLKSFKPDVCVFDVMLPGKDGFETGKEVRHFSADTPILYLTAKSQTADVLKGFESGGNDYLKKPFSLEELIVRIENLHQMHESVKVATFEPNKFTLGTLSFDPQNQTLGFDQNVKRLSFSETQLLQMLVERKGEVIKRKDILNKIWGDDHFFNSRNLDVYITKLRGYLKADANVKLLTLKSVGYRVVEG